LAAEGLFIVLNVKSKVFLKTVNLENFRLFKKKKFSFDPQINLILGANTSGKTSILEAIYLLSTGKSFRAREEVEMIRYGQEVSSLKSQVSGLELQITLTTGEVQGKRTRKKLYKVNGVGKRWRDFAGQLKCVLFRPEDITLILGSPSIRRNYLDSVLEQIDWQYRACSLAYQKGLRQRNKLLARIREAEAQPAQLLFWNKLLIKNGQMITKKREELIEFFNQYLSKEKKDKNTILHLFVNYDRSTITEKRLAKYAQAELALGSTLVGPHRDDFFISAKKKRQNSPQAKGRNLALYGSRGEQRMAILELKVAELEFIRKKSGQQPILLLDDIFSELDKKHRKLVLKIIDSSQTLITGTEVNQNIEKLTSKTLLLA
jgi:DNA replication and repair protein RecF